MSVKYYSNIKPVISKIYCSSSETVLVVRRRPHVISGGGFVVTDCSQKVVFRVDGCGVVGTNGELVVRDVNGDPVLLIRRKGGMVQALSLHRKWKGYAYDYEGSQKQVFSLKEPKPISSCLVRNNVIAIRVSTNHDETTGSSKSWSNFEIKGYFPDRDCSIVDSVGNSIVAQVTMNLNTKATIASKDVYYVVVKPGSDQAFVVGVIATLDHIYGESTVC